MSYSYNDVNNLIEQQLTGSIVDYNECIPSCIVPVSCTAVTRHVQCRTWYIPADRMKSAFKPHNLFHSQCCTARSKLEKKNLCRRVAVNTIHTHKKY